MAGKKNSFSKRATIAWRAFSVWSLATVAALPEWYPHVKTIAVLYLGPDADKTLATIIAVSGIVGWMIPQKKVQDHVQKTS